MKKYIFTVLFVFILPIFAFCANIDTSLYSGSSKVLIDRYEKLLVKLNTKTNGNYDTQKTILYTLINILKSPVNTDDFNLKKINVKNQNDYLFLLRNVAEMQLKHIKIKNKIDNIDKKLQTLKNTIELSDNNSSDTMTYQLQYAFYEITLERLKEDERMLSVNIPKLKGLLYKTFLRVKFDDKLPKSAIKDSMARYDKLNDYIEKLNIEKDRLVLLNKTDRLADIGNKLAKALNSRDSAVMDIIDNYVLIYLYDLKNSKDLQTAENNILKWTDRLVEPDKAALAKRENSLLYYITKKKLGVVKTFIKRIQGSGSNIALMVWSFVKKPIFSVGNAHISIFNIVLALFIFIFGIYTGSKYKKHIKTAKFSKNITLSTKTILGNIGYYTIVLITFFISLKIIGINLSSLTVILGALSVGIGFGLQNMVSNFISGIILMLENSIRIGDYIEISDTLKGVVEDIQMRSTTIVTNDNIEVIIPNQTLFQNNVINWTLSEKIRRFRIPFGVAYGTDVSKVQKVVLESLEKSGLNYIKNNPDKAPEIKMVAMNNSSVDFNLDVWVEGDDVIYPRRTESRFLIMIYGALNENDIVIPFPQLDIHVKEPVVLDKNDGKQSGS